MDGEVVACREDGAPDFRALHSGNYTQEVLCVWCFDMMEINGKDLRPLPLIAWRQKLETLLRRHDHPHVRYSEFFRNGEQPLAECRTRGLEGVASKQKQAPYKSGKCDWVKVKCAQWKVDNKDRGDLFMPLYRFPCAAAGPTPCSIRLIEQGHVRQRYAPST